MLSDGLDPTRLLNTVHFQSVGIHVTCEQSLTFNFFVLIQTFQTDVVWGLVHECVTGSFVNSKKELTVDRLRMNDFMFAALAN